MSPCDTISLAHTARCKLRKAADKPDRDLRFILGHAFTLDNLRLRILEIEQDMESVSDGAGSDNLPVMAGPRRVSFSQNPHPQNARKTRYRSPPPGADAHVDTAVEEEEEEDEDEDMEEDDEEDGGLSLQRFSSASEQPPRMIADEGSDEGSDEEDEEDEAVSPTQMPTEMELRSITTGEADEELAGLYKTVKGCPCHGEHKSAPDITKAWEVPQKEGYQGKRLAIVEVAA